MSKPKDPPAAAGEYRYTKSQSTANIPIALGPVRAHLVLQEGNKRLVWHDVKEMVVCPFNEDLGEYYSISTGQGDNNAECTNSGLLRTPPPERLFDTLGEGTPRMAPIRRGAWRGTHQSDGAAGGYSSGEEVVEVFGRRRAANARERQRVSDLNRGFSRLRRLVPLVSLNQKPNKLDTLRATISYIHILEQVLETGEGWKMVGERQVNESLDVLCEGEEEEDWWL
uniref:factor in the germline alpha n=1 Tax=Myxine glutinosa TaxID=7769 RepID=UPI00358EA764